MSLHFLPVEKRRKGWIFAIVVGEIIESRVEMNELHCEICANFTKRFYNVQDRATGCCKEIWRDEKRPQILKFLGNCRRVLS